MREVNQLDAMASFVMYAVDIGSISSNRFGWSRSSIEQGHIRYDPSGTDIWQLVQGISTDLAQGYSVALGFECPLFISVTNDPIRLSSARSGEGDRPWSAGAGCGSLAVGLAEYARIFDRLRTATEATVIPTFSWERFINGQANLFLWEAFVTSKAKSQSHTGDAEAAAKSFWAVYPNISQADMVAAERPFSLVGAALLWSGLTQNSKILGEKCTVIRS